MRGPRLAATEGSSGMSQHSMVATSVPQPTKILGIPLGDMGFFHSLMVAVIFGFIAFFAACFFAIFGLLIYNQAGHHNVDMADAYIYGGVPVGVAGLAIAVVVLMGMWLRRKLAGR